MLLYHIIIKIILEFKKKNIIKKIFYLLKKKLKIKNKNKKKMFHGAFNKFKTSLLTNIQPKSNLTNNFQQLLRKASTVSVPAALTDIKTSWKTLSVEEQVNLTKQLEELQKQDWNKLSLEEKKACKE